MEGSEIFTCKYTQIKETMRGEGGIFEKAEREYVDYREGNGRLV